RSWTAPPCCRRRVRPRRRGGWGRGRGPGLRTGLSCSPPFVVLRLRVEVRFKSRQDSPMLSIGAVARQAGLRPSAIRYYERLGLLPAPGRVGGRRRYGPDVLTRLAVISFARASGFTLREVRRLLGGKPYSLQLRRLARAKILELDGVIERAHAMQALLR